MPLFFDNLIKEDNPMQKSYFVLPNTAFGLSSEEFSVLAYLLSIPTAKKRVRQQTIAEKCNIGSRNTVTKAINSLLAK